MQLNSEYVELFLVCWLAGVHDMITVCCEVARDIPLFCILLLTLFFCCCMKCAPSAENGCIVLLYNEFHASIVQLESVYCHFPVELRIAGCYWKWPHSLFNHHWLMRRNTVPIIHLAFHILYTVVKNAAFLCHFPIACRCHYHCANSLKQIKDNVSGVLGFCEGGGDMRWRHEVWGAGGAVDVGCGEGCPFHWGRVWAGCCAPSQKTFLIFGS